MRFIISFFIITFTHLSYAAETKEIASLSNETIGVTNYLQMFFGLFIVVALIFGMAWFMRRMGKINGMASGDLKVLGGISVGQRERVVLIQAGETQILLGVSPGAVRNIHVLENPIVSQTSSNSKVPSAFSDKLYAAIKNRSQV